MATTTGDINAFMRNGIKFVFGHRKSYKDLWRPYFKTTDSTRNAESASQFNSTSTAVVKPQGSPVAQSQMSARFQKYYINQNYGQSFGITKEAFDDNQYKEVFPEAINGLRVSLQNAQNQAAANVHNHGHTTEFSVDGVPFFSNSHPLGEGQLASNRAPINVALSEVGTQDGIVNVQLFKQINNIFSNVIPTMMLVSPQGQFAAKIIIGSGNKTSIGSDPGMANADRLYAGVNDINVINCESLLPKGYHVNHYISSPTHASLCTDMENGLIHFERKKMSTRQWVDNTTLTTWTAAEQRYNFGVIDWRCGYLLSI